MVLYHASTMYHVLCAMVHRLAYHGGEEAQLLMMEYTKPLRERKSFAERLTSFGYFSSVRYVPEKQIRMKNGRTLNQNSSEEEINSVIDSVCRAFSSWFGEDMRKFSEIYVASDQHSLGIYLIKNKIPYTYMEDASGMLSEQQRYLDITKSGNTTNYIINNYLGAAGRNALVKAKLCDLKHQSPGFYDEKAVDFSIYTTLKNLIPEHTAKLLEFFGVKQETIKADRKICLFLTQDLNTLSHKDIDYQELMTTTLVDYICPKHQLIIKPHPKDRWLNYRRIFPDSLILPRSAPSELLPFSIKGSIDLALTASSTSIRGVSEFIDRTYYFTTDIEINRDGLDSMFTAVEVLKAIEITGGVSLDNINNEQAQNFLDNAGIKADGNYILIDGGLSPGRLLPPQNSAIALYLSTADSLNFNPALDTDSLFLITTQFIPDEDSLMPKKELYSFAFCHDEKLRRRLENLRLEKRLKYTRSDVLISCRSFDERLKKRMTAIVQQEEKYG